MKKINPAFKYTSNKFLTALLLLILLSSVTNKIKAQNGFDMQRWTGSLALSSWFVSGNK